MMRIEWKRLLALVAIGRRRVGHSRAAPRARRSAAARRRCGRAISTCAVAAYRKAVQAAPENATYKIALQRAMLAASRAHMDRAREYEQMDQLEAARRRIQAGVGERSAPTAWRRRRSSTSSGPCASGRRPRGRSRPFKQLRERARAAAQRAAAVQLHDAAADHQLQQRPAARHPHASSAASTGINVTYDRQYQDRNFIGAAQRRRRSSRRSTRSWRQRLSYKVLSERSILIFETTRRSISSTTTRSFRRSISRMPTPPSWRSCSARRSARRALRAAGDRAEQGAELDHDPRARRRSSGSSKS